MMEGRGGEGRWREGRGRVGDGTGREGTGREGRGRGEGGRGGGGGGGGGRERERKTGPPAAACRGGSWRETFGHMPVGSRKPLRRRFLSAARILPVSQASALPRLRQGCCCVREGGEETVSR